MQIKETHSSDGNRILAHSIMNWYEVNQRILPWRKNRDPYRIWISEVMLQQTTVQAVIPFYERFMSRFPELQTLAEAPLEDVLESWAGLGYYSRARNLHKAAQTMAKTGFPQTAAELLELPGFGPYTSRAVASLAYGEKVGVLDGNVIRVLTRVKNLKIQWWKTKEKNDLQLISDELNQHGKPHLINQGLMELGATICTPERPTCFLCPWISQCEAHKNDTAAKLPLPKPRKAFEIWIWEPQILIKNKKLALVENNYAPFLKGQLILPGKVKKSESKPKNYQSRHSITHHQIFIQPKKSTSLSRKDKLQWVALDELKKKTPSSLMQKALAGLAEGKVLSMMLTMGLCLVTALHLVACKSADKSEKSSSKPTAVVAVPASSPNQEIKFGSRLTAVGENFRARFSADGQSLIFVSRGRLSYKNQQIMSISLTDSKEKRLTYSNGDADFPVFLNSAGRFAYVSDTDSAKESPKLFSGSESATKGTDLFVSEATGYPIEKLSHISNSYTSLDVDGDKFFVFSLNKSGEHRIGLQPLSGGNPIFVFDSKDKDVVFALRNRHQLTLWLEEDPIQPAVLKTKKGAEKIKEETLPFVSIHDMSWWDADRETILVSGKLNKDRLDTIYLYDLRFHCLIQVAQTTTDLWFPSVNADKNLLAVTLIDHGLRQIYINWLASDLGQCSPPGEFESTEPSTIVTPINGN